MAARVQNLINGWSKGKQSNIATAASTFLRFKKLDTGLTTPKPIFENDAPEIGKGHEFITQTYASHYEVGNSVEKYASAEWVTWVCAFALGGIVQTGSGAPYTYTITPQVPGTAGLELPYFSQCEQVPDVGGNCIDNLYIGCAVEEFVHELTYGPGPKSSKLRMSWVGTGQLTTPSGITIPTLQSENNMLAASATCSVNSVDYVATKRLLTCSVGWKNNFLRDAGFFPGSGLQNGLQIAGRIEFGARVPSFMMRARLLFGSTEYNTLVNQTTGTATVSVQHDANNSVSYAFPQMAFQAVENGQENGIVDVTITGAPEYSNSSGVFTVTALCGIAGIAQ